MAAARFGSLILTTINIVDQEQVSQNKDVNSTSGTVPYLK